jgi:ABC-2 type transport system permease protein
MLRLLSTIQKEVLILLRDRGGLAIMFFMPVAMITIMAVIQDAPFKDYQELKIPLLLVNKDTGSLGKTIEHGLTESKIAAITKLQISDEDVKKKIKAGDFEIGIIIPAGATEVLNTNVTNFVSQKLAVAGLADTATFPVASHKELTLQILFAPGTKKSFKATIQSSLKQSSSKLETKTLLDFFSKRLAATAPTDTAQQQPIKDFINFTEVSTIDTPAEALLLNSVQHNVPAWTIFGMFFIVISMAGSIIKERDDGSYTRIRTMPGSFVTVLIGKISAYLLVCIIQCVLMLLVGMYVLPHLGLPPLQIGNSIAGIFVVALCTGLAATGYGVMIGSIFRTHQQSSTFGAVSIVILAALGGIWVPVYIMPDAIQTLAEFSPLYWSLNAFHKIFLNNGTLESIWIYAVKLLAFFIVTLGVAYFYNRARNR